MISENQLDYLKEAFLKKANLLVFYKQPLNEEEQFLASYQTNLEQLREVVNNSSSIAELKYNMNYVKQHFMDTIWRDIFDKEGKVKQVCVDFYFNSGIDDVDKFLADNSKLYEDKVQTGFIDRIKTAISTLFNDKPTLKKVTPLLSDIDAQIIQKRASELIEKYSLASVDLSAFKTSKEALKFLDTFDKNADEAFSRMNVNPKAFGINETIHLRSNTVTEAWYNRGTKVISLAQDHMSASTILHEWIHAIDNHVCLTHTGVNNFVSEMETSQIKDTSKNALAFNILKSLTQKIFNDNFDNVAKIKEEELEKGASKFWSTILGPQWYGMEQKSREKLLSSTVLLDINNYVSKPTTETTEYILEAMEKVGFNNRTANLERLEIKETEINNVVKPFFDNVNKNLIGSKSFYYISSYLANLDRRLNNFMDKMMGVKGKDDGTKNLYDNDYYVQPCEMLARYFQGQVFPEIHKASKFLDFCHPYTTKQDSDFELFKDNIIGNALGKDMILSNRDKLREPIQAVSQNKNKP